MAENSVNTDALRAVAQSLYCSLPLARTSEPIDDRQRDLVLFAAAARISQGYWVTAEFVYDVLIYLGTEERVRLYLDVFAPTGRIPSAADLQALWNGLQ